VWLDQSLTLQPSFKQIVANDYKATLASVDFQNKVCIYILYNLQLFTRALFLFSVNYWKIPDVLVNHINIIFFFKLEHLIY
jgi:hypothetical protein